MKIAPLALSALLAASGISAAALGSRASAGGDSQFMVAMQAGMSKMMSAMDVEPSGNVDRDFVAAMVPHHQGAIDMARSELLFGRDPQLRRIAQEIIVDQQQEIAAMRFALGQPLPPSMPAPDQTPAH
jgi:uncharacterized protein (DUF305 family)